MCAELVWGALNDELQPDEAPLRRRTSASRCPRRRRRRSPGRLGEHWLLTLGMKLLLIIVALASFASCLAYVPTAPSGIVARARPRAPAVSASFLDKVVVGIADSFSGNKDGDSAANQAFRGLMSYGEDKRKANASHVLLSFEAYPDDGEVSGDVMASALMGKIAAGELAFELVAQKFSSCTSAEKGGNLGSFGRKVMVPPFDEVVFDDSVPVGTLLGPVKTQFGHHIIRVEARDD